MARQKKRKSSTNHPQKLRSEDPRENLLKELFKDYLDSHNKKLRSILNHIVYALDVLNKRTNQNATRINAHDAILNDIEDLKSLYHYEVNSAPDPTTSSPDPQFQKAEKLKQRSEVRMLDASTLTDVKGSSVKIEINLRKMSSSVLKKDQSGSEIPGCNQSENKGKHDLTGMGSGETELVDKCVGDDLFSILSNDQHKSEEKSKEEQEAVEAERKEEDGDKEEMSMEKKEKMVKKKENLVDGGRLEKAKIGNQIQEPKIMREMKNVFEKGGDDDTKKKGKEDTHDERREREEDKKRIEEDHCKQTRQNQMIIVQEKNRKNDDFFLLPNLKESSYSIDAKELQTKLQSLLDHDDTEIYDRSDIQNYFKPILTDPDNFLNFDQVILSPKDIADSDDMDLVVDEIADEADIADEIYFDDLDDDCDFEEKRVRFEDDILGANSKKDGDQNDMKIHSDSTELNSKSIVRDTFIGLELKISEWNNENNPEENIRKEAEDNILHPQKNEFLNEIRTNMKNETDNFIGKIVSETMNAMSEKKENSYLQLLPKDPLEKSIMTNNTSKSNLKIIRESIKTLKDNLNTTSNEFIEDVESNVMHQQHSLNKEKLIKEEAIEENTEKKKLHHTEIVVYTDDVKPAPKLQSSEILIPPLAPESSTGLDDLSTINKDIEASADPVLDKEGEEEEEEEESNSYSYTKEDIEAYVHRNYSLAFKKYSTSYEPDLVSARKPNSEHIESISNCTSSTNEHASSVGNSLLDSDNNLKNSFSVTEDLTDPDQNSKFKIQDSKSVMGYKYASSITAGDNKTPTHLFASTRRASYAYSPRISTGDTINDYSWRDKSDDFSYRSSPFTKVNDDLYPRNQLQRNSTTTNNNKSNNNINNTNNNSNNFLRSNEGDSTETYIEGLITRKTNLHLQYLELEQLSTHYQELITRSNKPYIPFKHRAKVTGSVTRERDASREDDAVRDFQAEIDLMKEEVKTCKWEMEKLCSELDAYLLSPYLLDTAKKKKYKERLNRMESSNVRKWQARFSKIKRDCERDMGSGAEQYVLRYPGDYILRRGRDEEVDHGDN